MATTSKTPHLHALYGFSYDIARLLMETNIPITTMYNPQIEYQKRMQQATNYISQHQSSFSEYEKTMYNYFQQIVQSNTKTWQEKRKELQQIATALQ